MKATLSSLIIALSIFTLNSATQASTTFNTRLLVHAKHQNVEDTGVGITGWLLAPNITSDPSKWLGIAGPRFDGECWNLELMAGGVINTGEATALIDLRFELTPDLFNIPLYVWGNVEWIDTGNEGTLYSYLQIDYKLPLDIGLIGLETENATPLDGEEGDWSFGPQLVLPFGEHFALVAAYQFHFGAGSGQRFWLRIVFNL